MDHAGGMRPNCLECRDENACARERAGDDLFEIFVFTSGTDVDVYRWRDGFPLSFFVLFHIHRNTDPFSASRSISRDTLLIYDKL